MTIAAIWFGFLALGSAWALHGAGDSRRQTVQLLREYGSPGYARAADVCLIIATGFNIASLAFGVLGLLAVIWIALS